MPDSRHTRLGYKLVRTHRSRGPTPQQAAVKGGRRPAERTLDSRAGPDFPPSKMELAGRRAAGLDAIPGPRTEVAHAS